MFHSNRANRTGTIVDTNTYLMGYLFTCEENGCFHDVFLAPRVGQIIFEMFVCAHVGIRCAQAL